MDMAMVIMDIMARDLLMLSQLLLLSPDMDMVMDMAMATMDTMAKDPLMLSLVMDIMAMDMDTMDMVMVMAMDTTVKLISCLLVEFSTNEVGPIRSSQKTHTFN